MRDYRIHVLLKVGDDVRDVMFSSTKSLATIEGDMLKIETQNTFDEMIVAAVFNMDEIIGYYDDLRTSSN